jgi:hypothetical protein
MKTSDENTMSARRWRSWARSVTAPAALLLAVGLGGCVYAPPYGYAPAPAYGYAYGPAYYPAPAVSVGVGFGGGWGGGGWGHWHGR